MNKESLKKAWGYIRNAQNEVSLRFTDDTDCDKLVRKAYNELDKILDEIKEIVYKNKYYEHTIK